MTKRHVGFIGAGMITHDQNLPAVLELARKGEVDQVHIAATGSASIRRLLTADRIRSNYPEFPPEWFKTYPSLDTPDDAQDRTYYRKMLDALPSGSVVVVGIPDVLHANVILECLERRLHVVTVKSLCTNYTDALRIRTQAAEYGLFVGIDYHKMFDDHARLARERWKAGQFGRFRAARATMIEDDSYFRQGSPFSKHFTAETSDPATYVLCHYLQQVEWLTGERPVSVSVMGVRDRFPGTNVECYSWAGTTFGYAEESAVFTGLNGLQHPAHHATRNHQGLEIWGTSNSGDGAGTYLHHADHRRGMDYALDLAALPAASRVVDGGTDYIGWIPRLDGGPGRQMVGYGFRAIHDLVTTAFSVGTQSSVEDRRTRLQQIDQQYLLATPGNTAWLGLVYEAMRLSIRNRGKLVDIDYDFGQVALA